MCFKKHCKEITYIDVKVKRLNFTNQTEIIKVPFLDPDTVMQYLINAGLTIPQEQVVEFWENKRHSGETWVENCPATNQHIPIAIYGDACRLYTARKDSKYLGIFISLPLWRPRSTRYSRWCIFRLKLKKLHGTQTLHPVLQRITYKLNMLFENGLLGPNGRVYNFCCSEIRGDWEWHKQLFDLTSSWKSVTQVCFRCNCTSRSDNPKELFYCLDHDPAWREFTLTDFVASQIKHWPPCTFSELGRKC